MYLPGQHLLTIQEELMSAKVTLEDLLQDCTVRVSVDGEARGSGFFVAPGLVLTCFHVVEEGKNIEISRRGQSQEARLAEALPDPDLALLAVAASDHPCVLLCGKARPHSKLYSYGYPRWDGEGTGLAYITGGPAGPQSERLTFQDGRVDYGMSGAPLLDLESGSVCGIIQFSLKPASNLGGQALQAEAVLQALPALAQAQQNFHRQDARWLRVLRAEQRRRLAQLCPQYAAPAGETVKVFLSFVDHPQDRRLQKRLETHLAGLKREGAIESWHAEQLGAGRERREVERLLAEADIILLLISPDYLASDYHYEEEMRRAMERHAEGSARVIPIILRATDLEKTPFAGLVSLPRDGRPLNDHQNKDAALKAITEELRCVVEEIRRERRSGDWQGRSGEGRSGP
jgi:hypothetical protein